MPVSLVKRPSAEAVQAEIDRLCQEAALALRHALFHGERSQAELARRAGWSASRVTDLVTGKRNFTLKTLVRAGLAVDIRWSLVAHAAPVQPMAHAAHHPPRQLGRLVAEACAMDDAWDERPELHVRWALHLAQHLHESELSTVHRQRLARSLALDDENAVNGWLDMQRTHAARLARLSQPADPALREVVRRISALDDRRSGGPQHAPRGVRP